MDNNTIKLSEDTAKLPNAEGFGDLLDLQQAMELDTQLKELVKQYIDETNPATRDELLDQVIYRWAGADKIDPYSRDPKKIYGHVMDARQLVVFEYLTSKGYLGTWCGGERDPNPHGKAAPILIAEYLRFKKYTEAQILIQTTYVEDFKGIIQSGIGSHIEKIIIDWNALQLKFNELLNNGETEKLKTLVSVLDNLGNYWPHYRQERDQIFQAVELANPVFVDYLGGATHG